MIYENLPHDLQDLTLNVNYYNACLPVLVNFTLWFTRTSYMIY